MNVICMEVTAHHIRLQVAHRNMWNSILPVNLRMRSWENDFRHTLKIICVIQYLHLADEGFCYLVLSLFFCGKYWIMAIYFKIHSFQIYFSINSLWPRKYLSNLGINIIVQHSYLLRNVLMQTRLYHQLNRMMIDLQKIIKDEWKNELHKNIKQTGKH